MKQAGVQMRCEFIFTAAQPSLQLTRRNWGDFLMQMRWNAFPIYQRHPASS
jgi:hypothetical protein